MNIFHTITQLNVSSKVQRFTSSLGNIKLSNESQLIWQIDAASKLSRHFHINTNLATCISLTC